MTKDPAAQKLKQKNNSLSLVLGQQLDVPGTDLTKVTRKAGRLLPRGLRREARYLIEAEQLASHPKLRSQLDPKRLKRADRSLRAFVRDRDPGRERMDRFLGQIGGLAFSLLLFAGLVITVLAWRGLIGPGS